MTAIDDRRQLAREAGHDLAGPSIIGDNVAAIEAAVETATSVKITAEIEAEFRAAAFGHGGLMTGEDLRRGLTAAFEAAGFEVVE